MSTAPPTQSRGFGFAAFGTLLHAAQLFALLVLYISYIPRSKKTFDEFGMTLPWFTQTVIKFSNWVSEYWWALVPVAMALGALDFALTVILRKRSTATAILWIVGVVLVLFVPAAIALVAVELPMIKLREGLAR
jgi:type II secretory pathway component PulF